MLFQRCRFGRRARVDILRTEGTRNSASNSQETTTDHIERMSPAQKMLPDVVPPSQQCLSGFVRLVYMFHNANMDDGDGFVTARSFEQVGDAKVDAGSPTLRRVTVLDPDTGYISSAGSINQPSSIYDNDEETAAREDWDRIINGFVQKQYTCSCDDYIRQTFSSNTTPL